MPNANVRNDLKSELVLARIKQNQKLAAKMWKSKVFKLRLLVVHIELFIHVWFISKLDFCFGVKWRFQISRSDGRKLGFKISNFEENRMSQVQSRKIFTCMPLKLKETNISNEHNRLKNPNWQEADQLALYKHDQGVEL